MQKQHGYGLAENESTLAALRDICAIGTAAFIHGPKDELRCNVTLLRTYLTDA